MTETAEQNGSSFVPSSPSQSDGRQEITKNEVKTWYIVYQLTENNEKEKIVCSSAPDLLAHATEEKVSILLNKKLQLVKDRSFTDIIICSPRDSFLCVFCYITNVTEDQTSQFLVCLLITYSESIENSIQLMLPDVNNYVVDIVAPLLFDHNSVNAPKNVETTLEQWYSASIDYIGRCVSCLGSYLPKFLHAALLGHLVISSENQAMETNLRRVADMIHLVEKDESKQIDVTFGEEQACTSYEHSNAFCEDWAHSLQQTADDPILCRQKIDQYRLVVVKRLNDLRRMLDNARTHNHDLYRSFSMIEHSNNDDVLLAILTNDIKNNKNLAEVIGTIVEFSALRKQIAQTN